MGLYREYYEITLMVNDREIELIPNAFSFSQTDSIHKLFSTGRVLLNDETGLLQEYMGADVGNRITLNYGTEEKTNENHYIIIGNSMTNASTYKYLSGEVDIPLKHEWFNRQNRSSRSFNDRISEVIQSLLESYNFNDLDINDTQNKDFWYQANRTEAEFIKEVLRDRAFSTNTGGTPFFAYITNDNVFHLRHLQSMNQQKSIAKYVYDPSRFNTKSEEGSLYTFYDVTKWQTEVDSNTKKLRNIEIYYINKDGSLVKKETETLPNHTSGDGTQYPILNDSGNATDTLEFFFKDNDNDNTKGRINSAFRDNLFSDRFMVTAPLNPELQSGQKIEVEFLRQDDEEGSSSSERYSGEYIIEMCTHNWDKDRSMGETMLVIGRGLSNLPSNYLFSRYAMER